MRIAIGIATANRRDVLTDTVAFLRVQTRKPDRIIISVANLEDVDQGAINEKLVDITVIQAPIGSSAQRNKVIEACDEEVLIFMDDDFMPSADFVDEVYRLFAVNQNVIVATGTLLADGILTVGLTHSEARDMLTSAKRPTEEKLTDVFNGYGCNMAVRLGVVKEHDVRFDEALPLYGWLEDVDFSRLLAPYGRIVRSSLLRGVHLGTKRSGRSPGKRLGYSQVANPVYLARKGTLPWGQALSQITRNLLANSVMSFAPEPWVDRRGRFYGNLLAIVHCSKNSLSPKRILDMG